MGRVGVTVSDGVTYAPQCGVLRHTAARCVRRHAADTSSVNAP